MLRLVPHPALALRAYVVDHNFPLLFEYEHDKTGQGTNC
jgi:hypothetical protein